MNEDLDKVKVERIRERVYQTEQLNERHGYKKKNNEMAQEIENIIITVVDDRGK